MVFDWYQKERQWIMANNQLPVSGLEDKKVFSTFVDSYRRATKGSRERPENMDIVALQKAVEKVDIRSKNMLWLHEDQGESVFHFRP